MGRGRAKAKQTKVARELKYNTPTTDLDSLQRELGSTAPLRPSPIARDESDDDDLDDRWASQSR
jgi:Protein of unknown function (DUF3073)